MWMLLQSIQPSFLPQLIEVDNPPNPPPFHAKPDPSAFAQAVGVVQLLETTYQIQILARVF